MTYKVKQCQTITNNGIQSQTITNIGKPMHLLFLSGKFDNLSSPGFWSCKCISFCWRAPNLKNHHEKWEDVKGSRPALDMVKIIRVQQTCLWCQHLDSLLNLSYDNPGSWDLYFELQDLAQIFLIGLHADHREVLIGEPYACLKDKKSWEVNLKHKQGWEKNHLQITEPGLERS